MFLYICVCVYVFVFTSLSVCFKLVCVFVCVFVCVGESRWMGALGCVECVGGNLVLK